MQILTQVWSRAQDFAFPTSSQMLLVVQGHKVEQ